MPKRTGWATESENIENFKYLLKPCIHLFQASSKLLSLVLDLFNPFILGEIDNTFPMEPARKVQIAISLLLILHDDVRAQINHCSSEGSVKVVFENIKNLLVSTEIIVLSFLSLCTCLFVYFCLLVSVNK